MRKPKYLYEKNEIWMLAEDALDIDFLFCQIFISSFVNDLKDSCGRNYKKVLAVFHQYHIQFYYGEKDSLNFEKHLMKLLVKNPSFGYLINKNIIKNSDKLANFANKLAKIDMQRLSNEKLYKLIETQDRIHTELYKWGWLSNATDMFHNIFTAI